MSSFFYTAHLSSCLSLFRKFISNGPSMTFDTYCFSQCVLQWLTGKNFYSVLCIGQLQVWLSQSLELQGHKNNRKDRKLCECFHFRSIENVWKYFSSLLFSSLLFSSILALTTSLMPHQCLPCKMCPLKSCVYESNAQRRQLLFRSSVNLEESTKFLFSREHHFFTISFIACVFQFYLYHFLSL